MITNMQPSLVDFLEVERLRVFDASLNIDGYDFTNASLRMEVRLTPETLPILTFEGAECTKQEGDTDWVIRLQKTGVEMDIPARSYIYDLVDRTTNNTIIKGRFEVL